jgi:hypothetical protein
MRDTLLHFAAVDGFIRFMAANPGYVIVSTLPGYHAHYSVLLEKADA